MKQRQYYGTVEAAEVLQVSLDTVRRMLRDGRLNGSKLVGNRVRIPAAEVEKWLVPVYATNNK